MRAKIHAFYFFVFLLLFLEVKKFDKLINCFLCFPNFVFAEGHYDLSSPDFCPPWSQWVGETPQLSSCSFSGQRRKICEAWCLHAIFCRYVFVQVSLVNCCNWRNIWCFNLPFRPQDLSCREFSQDGAFPLLYHPAAAFPLHSCTRSHRRRTGSDWTRRPHFRPFTS